MAIPIYLLLLTACCGYAALRGGAPERMGVVLLVSAVAASSFLPSPSTVHFDTLETGVLVSDSALFVAVTCLALRANRYWPMWWAALKLNTVITHVMMLAPTIIPWSYAVVNALWSFPSPILIAVGTLRHQQRLRRYGSDKPWTSQFGKVDSDGDPNEAQRRRS